jgi:2-dehydro-3-deoxyphosphogalactonate aldolase
MKIVGVETFTVAVPSPPWGGDEWYFLKLLTDEGVHGWGEMAFLGANRGKHRSLNHEVAEIVETRLVGQDALQREGISRRLYSSLCCHHPDVIRGAILSAIDIALWDIAGKAFARPVYDLLGGKCREKIRAYSYIYDRPGRTDRKYYASWWEMWLTPEVCAERAAEMAEEGFNALKLDPIPPGPPPGEPITPWLLTPEVLSRAEKTVRLVREALGDACDILIGTHGQMTPAAALRLAKRLEPYDPLWFEEPVPPENARQMARVARGTSIPIATGERLTTVFDFVRLLEAEAVDILQPDLAACGGITECKKIAALGEAFYAQVAPHVWGGPISTAAALQVAACIPNFLIQESIHKSDHFFDELVQEPFRWEDGALLPPDRPGIGVELDEAALNAHRVD